METRSRKRELVTRLTRQRRVPRALKEETEGTSCMHQKTLKEDEDEMEAPCRESVGPFMWLADMTRPDIANAIRAVKKFLNQPGVQHWKVVAKVIQHLVGTRELGITCTGTGQDMVAYADINYSSKAEDRIYIICVRVSHNVCGRCNFVLTYLTVCTAIEYMSQGMSEQMSASRSRFSFTVYYIIFQPRIAVRSVKMIHLADGPVSYTCSKLIDIHRHFVTARLRYQVQPCREVDRFRFLGQTFAKSAYKGTFSHCFCCHIFPATCFERPSFLSCQLSVRVTTSPGEELERA